MLYIRAILFFLNLPLMAQDMAINKSTGHMAPQYVGELKSLKGRVYKKKVDSSPIEVTPGTRFFKDEFLITDEKTVAKILVVDDTLLTIGPKSEIQFSEFKFISKDNRKIHYSLIIGQMRGEVQRKAPEGDVIIKTKNATLGVRGTKIIVNHKIANEIAITEFALESGLATVMDIPKGLKYDLEKNERIIAVWDMQMSKSAIEQNHLNTDELNLLKDSDALLPFYNPQDLSSKSEVRSILYKESNQNIINSESPFSLPPRSDKKSQGSFKNLEKLNEKLKEEQEKSK